MHNYSLVLNGFRKKSLIPIIEHPTIFENFCFHILENVNPLLQNVEKPVNSEGEARGGGGGDGLFNGIEKFQFSTAY